MWPALAAVYAGEPAIATDTVYLSMSRVRQDGAAEIDSSTLDRRVAGRLDTDTDRGQAGA